jgi:hypothetical protein
MPTRLQPSSTRADRPALARAAGRWAAAVAAALATACGGGGGDAAAPGPGAPVAAPSVVPPAPGNAPAPAPAPAPGAPAPAPTPSTPPATSTWTLQPAGAPLDVAVTLDPARAVSADVPLGGGRIVATGADGTTYTLDVPANGLVAATRITLTPVTQVSNLPFGETASTTIGVQFAPEGLRFFAPATLTVRPAAPAAIPIERQLFFGWESTGRALSLVAPDPASAEIRLAILHFSGVGVVRSKGFDADIEPVRQRIGGDAEARIQSAAAERLTRARQRQLLGIATDDGGFPDDLFVQYQGDVVQPRIAAAGTSCAAGRLALQTVLGVERLRALLGIEGSGFGGAVSLMDTVAEVCMKEEFEICRDEHVITRILPQRLGVERQAQLLGLPAGSFAHLDRYVAGCLKFELQYESTSGSNTATFTYEEDVRANRLRLEWVPGSLTVRGNGPLQSTRYAPTSLLACARFENPQRFGSSVTAKLDWRFEGERVTDFKLLYDPQPTNSSFTSVDTCGRPPAPPVTITGLTWSTSYIPAVAPTLPIASDEAFPDGAYRLENWEVLGGATMARTERSYRQRQGPVEVFASDRFILYHTPGL